MSKRLTEWNEEQGCYVINVPDITLEKQDLINLLGDAEDTISKLNHKMKTYRTMWFLRRG